MHQPQRLYFKKGHAHAPRKNSRKAQKRQAFKQERVS